MPLNMLIACPPRFRHGSQRSICAAPLAAAILAALFSEHAAAAPRVPSGVGLSNPTLALNLSGINNWSTEMPFLDLMKESRRWTVHGHGVWSMMSYQQLQAGGYLDANGWVKKIPPGATSVGTAWAWKDSTSDPAAVASRAGAYMLSFQGEGTLQIWGDAKVLSSQPGQIIFENLHGGSMFVNITSTDPNGTGDYIRDISVVRKKYEALYRAGEIFNPDWLSVVDDARELRFMDWMRTNGSTQTGWSGRPHVGDVTWAGEGAPVEVMVTLANQTGTDPWFNMPTEATDDYIRQFATYVRDHLDPGLKAYVEYSNETWNGSFQAYHWLDAQSRAKWGVRATADYSAMRATETALIWDRVFGGQASTRIENVLATQTANPWITRELLKAPVWAAHDPAHYVAPSSVFNSLAVTTYFGIPIFGNATLQAGLLAAIKDPNVDAAQWLATKLKDPSYKNPISQIKAQWVAQKAVAEQYGLKLVAYEGGQHVDRFFPTKGMTADNVALLRTFLADFVRSPEMADLYNQLWDAWAKVGNGPFMQFNDVGEPSKWGSWGLLSALGDSNPRAKALLAHNASGSSWFGDGGGTRYQHGVIKMADDKGDTLTGTLKDDYLIGGAGSDTFIPGTGHDGINGGAGIDTVVLSGTPSDYTLTPDGDGYRLTGPNTSDYIFNVENFRFDSNVTLSLSQMLKR